MRVLIIGQNYLPESTAGEYTADLAQHLTECGHQVYMVTGFPMASTWQVFESYRGRVCMREVINGVPLLRTYVYVPRNPKKALNRILFDISFSLSSLLGGLTVPRPEVIMAISPPLQVGLTGWFLSKITGARLFIHNKDLVPDLAVATGMLRAKSPVGRLAFAVERLVFRLADKIGVLSEGFARNLMKKGVKSEKIVVLPDFLNLESISPRPRENNFRQRHGIRSDEFLVMYSGSTSLKQGLNTLVDAAAVFNGHKQIKFFIIGEGPCLRELQEQARALQLSNLLFLPLQPKEELPEQLSAADVLVITQKQGVTDAVFPSKLLYYMATGRPTLAAVSQESDTGRFITKHQAGVVVPPGEPKSLAQAIGFLMGHQDEALRMGTNARRATEEIFDRRVVLKELINEIEDLANKS